ncbi:MAG TPA: penicillin-binding transpeptidase domain-containing protein [Longimicrobiaceae bacterium]|nr:penicillin-binding transpeptidase domain-containing protein [Longimicrobiaceae bacterium]
MLDTLLNWVLRAAVLLFAAGTLLALFRWLAQAFREKRERWPVRIALGMLLLAVVYGAGHARLLMQAEELNEGRLKYARFGDPRMAEINRAEVRGWILDCTGRDDRALARYGVREGEVERVYALGEGGANLVGGGEDAELRDYTVERLHASQLRRPLDFSEAGELHPAGTDLQLTLCAEPTLQAWSLLQQSGRPGAVVVQEVTTGALVAYAATGTAEQPPLGIKRYLIPGSVFKLALSAIWWENSMGDREMPCPAQIQVTPTRAIRNFESHAYPSLEVPREMLIVSCNTQAIAMFFEMRQRLGVQAVADALRSYGFLPYSDDRPTEGAEPFWNTGSAAWERRMTPPPNAVRILNRFDRFEWGQIAIGQGPVDVTPVGVSRFLQAIGNAGEMLPVTLERERLARVPPGRRIMSTETTIKLMEAMRGVVDEGTAVSVKPRLEGLQWGLGGKTGTADVRRGQRPDGWFAGLIFGPDDRPKYTVVVYLDQAGQGGRLPAAIAAGMVRFFAGWDPGPAGAEAQPEEAG